METIILIISIGIMNILCFFIGAKIGQKVIKGEEIKAPDISKLNASDFFSGAFNSQPKSVMEPVSSGSKNFTNIEIPDFLKR